MIRKNKIIVTGGAGFVGTNLIKLLLQKTKYKIISIDNYSSGSKVNHIKNSRVKLFLVNDKIQLAKFLKKNMYGKKIVIGMGAGSISNWMRELPQFMK